ncbi:hypothetical protein [Lacinutrix mariniflava]|uniref:hypothetical protein n=1 Tax=Lacinutrix mariniflava TaxID=342955 RepID=UPI000A9BE9CA|nr:hypothetical protein [Lacinutrix mariniflava]
MKNIFFSLLFTALLYTTSIYSQVAIGTSTPDSSSALQVDSTTGTFVPPRMTTEQMNLITTPLTGSLVFNTTLNSLCIYKNDEWSTISNSSIVLNKSYSAGNNALATPNNNYINFPIGSENVITTNSSIYHVISDGKIRIKEDGNYLFSASISTRNLPSGNKKYILALEINGNLVAYLSRGFSSLPSSDYWGTSGNVMYPVSANDYVTFRYVLNNGGAALDARFINLGISKLD